jgi:hypothetical protein
MIYILTHSRFLGQWCEFKNSACQVLQRALVGMQELIENTFSVACEVVKTNIFSLSAWLSKCGIRKSHDSKIHQ